MGRIVVKLGLFVPVVLMIPISISVSLLILRPFFLLLFPPSPLSVSRILPSTAFIIVPVTSMLLGSAYVLAAASERS